MAKKKVNYHNYADESQGEFFKEETGSSGLIKTGEMGHHEKSHVLLFVLIALLVILVLLFVFQKVYDAKRTKESFEAAVSEDNYTETPTEEEIIIENGTGYVEGQLVVVSEIGVEKADMEALFAAYDLEVVGYIELCDMYQVETKELESEDAFYELIEKLEAEENVEEVTLNYVYLIGEDDYLPVDDWDGYTISDSSVEEGACWGFEAINAPWLWENFDLGTVKVGVIDNMFAWDHRDLKFGKLYCNDYNDSEDGFYHGTHVSGIIGATHDNGKEIAGVLEDARIYGIGNYGEAFQVGEDEDSCDWVTSLVSSVALLVSDGAKVINYSAGYEVPVEYAEYIGATQEELIYEYENISYIVGIALQRMLDKGYDYVIACAAGNEACDSQYTSPFTAVNEPDVKNRIIVTGSATYDGNGRYSLSDFSNRGERIDVIAPGEDIYSTLLGSGIIHGMADYLSGTSMASPFVTGEAAALWAFYPELNGAQIKTIVVKSADTSVSGIDRNLINIKTAFTEEFIDVSGVTLDYSERVLAVDETMLLTATVVPITATDTNIKWYSTDKTVATVDQSGLVTALAEGTTDIVARTTDGKIASCSLTVIPEVIEIDTGFVVKPKLECEIEYEIIGAVGECSYLYYVNQDDPNCYFSVFIKDTDTAEISIPKGRYAIYMTYGQNWYGTEYRFGDGAEYSLIDEILDYTNTRTSYSLALKVEDGNLGHTPIAEEEFPD